MNLKLLCILALAFSYAAVAGFQQVNRGSVNQVTYVTAAAGTTSLFATGNQAIFVEGSTTQIIKLPSATSLPIDWWYQVVNNSTGTVTVNDNSGALITTISTGRIGNFYLKAKGSAAGTWKVNVNAATADLSSFFLKSEFINASAGASDAGKPIKTNASGLLDTTFLASLSAGITQLTGDVTAGPGTGSVVATVAAVGGSTAANIATAEALANAATAANTAGAILKRDGSGQVAATTFTGALAGNSTTSSALAANPADCSTGKAIAIAANGDLTCSAVNLAGGSNEATGTLPAGNGGTGQTTIALAFDSFFKSVATTLGDLVYGGASGAPTRLAGDTSNTRKFLRTQSTSGAAQAPAWDTIATGDVAFATTSALAATAAVTIDWNVLASSGGVYTKTLAANTTFTFANPAAGQTIVVRITNTASNFTGTFSDARLKWPANTAPTITVGAKSDIITFLYDGTNIFGSYVQNF